MVEKFTTNLHVDKKIVALLSTSTYQKSFSSAIRELVGNAYDADALSVRITISDNFKSIEIEDDGNGMTRAEFDKYLTIGKKKSTSEFTRKYKRKRIGQFGVGFLSIFPFCEELEITTTVENSESVLTATIPAIDYGDDSTTSTTNVDEIPIDGVMSDDKSQRLKHYTKIRLIKPSHAVKAYFTKPDSKKRESIETMVPFEKFKWELQEDLPILFNPKLKSFKLIKYTEPIPINVFLNKEPLYRNELCKEVLEHSTKTIAGIKCEYIITTNYDSITPLEARGIKRRVNNVGIGVRTDFELKRDRGFSRLHWLQGEIYYSENIKAYLTVARDSFVASPVIDELNNFFADKLREWAYYVETVAVAEKDIEQLIQNTKKGSAAPKQEAIKANLDKLEEKGFKIVHVKKSAKSKGRIQVDKAKKTVIVEEGTDIQKDYIYVLGEKIEMVFSDKFKSDKIPCQFKNDKVIEVNRNYPLFANKSYGKIFQKIHILLLMAQKKNKTSDKMYEAVLKNILNEFDDLI
jgi:hypothetical protein